AVDAERRRIERDIHDGVQQRVVALSILLARVERAEADEARRLLSGARTETQHILDDLRDVAWRTYPEMLQRDGLVAA
ncbi:histidine kinase, partial [Pseudomonas sp. BGM005]|nr:histidine kinase [Pseudomonas sp. BG5]